MGTAFKLGGMRAGSGSKVRIAGEPKIEAVKSDVYVAPDGWKIFITSYSYEVSWPNIYAKWTLLITCKNLFGQPLRGSSDENLTINTNGTGGIAFRA